MLSDSTGEPPPSTFNYAWDIAKPGRPDVEGWSKGSYRSTDGMVKQSLGSTVEHSGLAGQAGYWRQR
ncbi:hypothetical protein [Burkholderia contaminans]|uniref:hypothetical protein n=1 Tax=Burkholderia contaminans TaxID=488447 RepID=UPI002445850D|nr:hypothetical protein [Burkholderia contaminans]